MAGTRRGPEGSGRPIKADFRPGERQARFEERLKKAKTDRGRVSAASEHLRSVMADPRANPAEVARITEQVVIYLSTLSEQLESTIARKEPTQ